MANWNGKTRGHTSRRGVAMLAFVAALLVIGILVLWLAQYAGTASISYSGHYISSAALYAADSGAELALREAKTGTDVDGDGTVGSVSNDGNDNNNPTLGYGSFKVSVSGKTYTATGVWQAHTRVTETTLQ